MGTMEGQIRKIVREEIARALGAVGAVAKCVWDDAEIDSAEEAAAQMLRRTMERVARDVLADVHPALEPEHTASTEPEHTASTEPVHTITAVPERSKATCTCIRHTHVMGHGDWCGQEGCFCRSPLRARPEHTDEHTSTETPRTCPTCKHGVHEAGKCTMHVYLRGVASPCPCLEWVRPEAVVSTRPNPMCTVCEHAPHGAGKCPVTVPHPTWPGHNTACTCAGQASTPPCTVCEHARHEVGNCGAVEWPATGPCECGAQPSTRACSYCTHPVHTGMYCPECRCKGGLS